MNSYTTYGAVCVNTTIGQMQEEVANFDPTTSSPQVSPSGAVGTSELPLIASVVVIGVLLFFLIVYSIRRYYVKLSTKYKRAMEITGIGLDDAFPAHPSQDSINNIDLDKLNYIADISDIQR